MSHSDEFNNVDVNVPSRTSDSEYLTLLRREFVPRAIAFKPEMIFWEYGFDATLGEYGDKGITADCHVEIARVIRKTADSACGGKLVAILCGGSGRKVANYTIPKIVRVLAGLS